MNKEQTNLTSLEIRNLILETLAYEGDDIDSEKKNFKKYGYQGSQTDLFRLMDGLAIKKGIIEEKVKNIEGAWGGCGQVLHEGLNTNFSRKNIIKIYEEFHWLITRSVLSPGANGSYGSGLPYFHVTEYGLECIKTNDILPYDQDGYLKRLNKIDRLDEWINFYIRESLKCFNAECLEASVIMLGLASELLTNNLIESFTTFLELNYPEQGIEFKRKIEDQKISIAKKYKIYLEALRQVRDEQIKKLGGKLDVVAKDVYLTYLRLNRNELAHPNNIAKDRIEVLMLLISFVKYCELQYLFIDYFSENSIENDESNNTENI